ncbi:MAG: ATP-grasp domain-containing protein [Methanobrevibacter sp.]|nr:ATP-grasp domain-containing protein [Methanobrevibacter sp.]
MNKTDFKEDDSILVFEYYTASGIDDLKIISEAVALIDSLLDDLKGLNVYFLLSKKFEYIAKNHEHLKSIIIEENLQKWLSKNVANFNGCMFISSEEDMILHEITNLIEKNNVKLYGSNTSATLLCSDKFKTYNHLEGVIKQPKTLKFTINEKFQWEIATLKMIDFFNLGNSKLFNDDCELSFKLIAKPVYGVDCQDTKIISNIHEFENLKNVFPSGSSFLIQEYIEGDIVSVSLISDGKIAIPISLNKQNILLDSNDYSYLGGELPFNHPLKDKAFEIAKKSVESINGIKGFVGVDLILDEDVYFLEINSRFTTPYVGIKKISSFNIGKSIIEIIDKKIAIGSIENDIKFDDKVKFIKNGDDLDIQII